MRTKAKARIHIHIIALLLAFATPLKAQESSRLLSDEQLAKLFEQERAKPNGKGLVIVGAALEAGCRPTFIHIGRITAGKYQYVAGILSEPRSNWDRSSALPSVLVRGEYVIGSVECKGFRSFVTINGPHAKFRVAPGEVVDLGFLQIDRTTTNIFTGQGTARRSVEDTSPGRLAFLREKFPRLVQRMVKRHMTILGPPLVGIKNPRSLF